MVNAIQRPTLLLDKNKCLQNIIKMTRKAKKHQLFFRPHFKTHQSITVGGWFKEQGVSAITVSSLSMAKFFAAAGWQDITVAFPINLREVKTINELAGRIQLNLLVESAYSTYHLAQYLKFPVKLFIEIDTGHHRSGLTFEQTEDIEAIIQIIKKANLLQFGGFLTHAGHTYQAQSLAEIKTIHHQSLSQLALLREKYIQIFPDLQISIGDTPSCSLMEDFAGVDEVRPGNFVFYDVMQWNIGSCKLQEIAVALACPVVAKYEARNEMVIYGGAVHLSKEPLILKNGRTCFGLMVRLQEKGWEIPDPLLPVIALSQEHGIVHVDAKTMSQINIGDLIGILPVHSCLTANLMKQYWLLDGTKIQDVLNSFVLKT